MREALLSALPAHDEAHEQTSRLIGALGILGGTRADHPYSASQQRGHMRDLLLASGNHMTRRTFNHRASTGDVGSISFTSAPQASTPSATS